MNKHLPTHRNAILQRVTQFPQTEMDAAMMGGPVTTWVAVTSTGLLGSIIAQGAEKDEVIQKLVQDGWKVTQIINDWN